jgi:hypothetical protein
MINYMNSYISKLSKLEDILGGPCVKWGLWLIRIYIDLAICKLISEQAVYTYSTVTYVGLNLSTYLLHYPLQKLCRKQALFTGLPLVIFGTDSNLVYLRTVLFQNM